MPVTDEDLELERLRRAKQRRTNRPGPLVFRGANKAFFEYRGHESVLSGPAETGKSLTATSLMHYLLATTPFSRGAMLRKTRVSLMETVHETYKSVIERSRVKPIPYGGENPQFYRYPNGARLYLGGMDNPQKVLSGERDYIYVCQLEEFELGEWETLTTRATGRAGATDQPQVFGDCNPGPPTHWILHRPSLKMFESRHVDNPRLYDDAGNLTPAGERSMAILDSLTGVLRERLYFGRWVAAEGQVYAFDRAKHLIDPFPIPPAWSRYMVIDFGYNNPFVALWLAMDPDKCVHLYRQHYMTKRTVKDHAEVIRRVERWFEDDDPKKPNPDRERIILRMADHDAEDRATLAQEGIGTRPAMKDIRPGIEALSELLAPAGNGKPRFFIHRNSLIQRDDELHEKHLPTCAEQEFDIYAYPKGVDGKAVKEVPIDLHNHAMDPLRYFALWLKRTGGSTGFFR